MKLELSVASTVIAAPLISIAPVVVISISAAFPAILIPPLPSRVKAPDEVVKLEAPVASNVIELELISTVPVVVISTSAAFPTILIPAAPLSVKAPAAVVNAEAVAASISTPPAVALISIAVQPVPAELIVTV